MKSIYNVVLSIVGQTINTIKKRKEISGWCGMVWACYIREKASKSRKKLNRQNDNRFYKGRKTLKKKHEVSTLTKQGRNITLISQSHTYLINFKE